MFQLIYSRSLWSIMLAMVIALIVWGCLRSIVRRRAWTTFNLLLLTMVVIIILYATLINREPGEYDVILTPFAAFAAARKQPELYREMLMNVFLFFPMGAALSNVLPRGWSLRRRIVLTTLAGCPLSSGIECGQYCFSLGLAEMDDVICNTFGAFLGSVSLLITDVVEKYKGRLSNMTLTNTETQFLRIVKAAVSGTALPAESVDWSAIFALANQQKLLPLIFESVRRLPAAEENTLIFAAAKQQVVGQVLNQSMRSLEFSALYQKLRAAGLHPIVVKGQLCSTLYPMKDHRISADDDLYIPDDEFLTCHEVLLANGLSAGLPAEELSAADEVSYTRTGSPLYIELHRHLFDSSEDAYDELNHFFVDLSPDEINGFLAMPPHEHLLYLILHAYKHFVSCGIGLRQFCDIGLWARAYYDRIDWQRLYEQCAGVHAATFAAAGFRIASECLGIALELPEIWKKSVDVEPLLHDTLCGGVYGSNDYTRLHSSTVTLNAVKSSRVGTQRIALRTLFPKRKYLERRYPYLKKCPYLLPVAWMQRIVHYAGEKRSDPNNSASGSIRLAEQRIALMKQYDIIDET